MAVPSSFFGGTAASFCYDKTCFWTRKAARSVVFKIYRHKKPPLPGLPTGPQTRAQHPNHRGIVVPVPVESTPVRMQATDARFAESTAAHSVAFTHHYASLLLNLSMMAFWSSSTFFSESCCWCGISISINDKCRVENTKFRRRYQQSCCPCVIIVEMGFTTS